jgi:16S rRNA (guanine966-N2)-methyltransferase
MRITGGEYGGRSFSPPKVDGFRPTMEKVRQAVFSMLQSQIDLAGCSVLDCYSGSGAFGLESISRGALHCTFIDKNPELIKFTNSIAEKLGILGQTRFVRGSLPAELEKQRAEFDLIFADPPYETSPGDFLAKLLELKILKDEGILVLETRKRAKEPPEDRELFLELLRDKTYGDTRIQLFRKKLDEQDGPKE